MPKVRQIEDMPNLLAEDYQPQRSNMTVILRRLAEVSNDLLRRGA